METSRNPHPQIAIIGGGPAGIAAAVQLKRYDLAPVLFEKNRLGGLLWNARQVDNYPGFPDGIPGAALAQRLANHLDAYNIPVIQQAVQRLDYDTQNRRFTLATGSGSHHADIAVIAPGTIPKTGSLPQLTPGLLKKYLYFEIQPLLQQENKRIIIIGAGDIAFDYALHLSEANGSRIAVVHRNEHIKALPLLHREVLKRPNIRFFSSSSPHEIAAGKTAALAVTFINDKGQTIAMEADYLVGAIGRVPPKSLYSPQVQELEKELIAQKRLYLAGDVKNGPFRQAAIAAGNGIQAAMDVFFNLTKAHDPNNQEN
jgi:thioredoxin reductase